MSISDSRSWYGSTAVPGLSARPARAPAARISRSVRIGALAATGPSYAANILGTLGIASGQTRAADFRNVRPIDFGALRNAAPVLLPFAGGGGIYAQYDQGVSGVCSGDPD